MKTREQRAKVLSDLGFKSDPLSTQHKLRLGCTVISISPDMVVSDNEWDGTIQYIKDAIKHHELLCEKKPVKASPDVYAALPGMSMKEKRELLHAFCEYCIKYIGNGSYEVFIDEFLNRK